jgi:hypothetical protein
MLARTAVTATAALAVFASTASAADGSASSLLSGISSTCQSSVSSLLSSAFASCADVGGLLPVLTSSGSVVSSSTSFFPPNLAHQPLFADLAFRLQLYVPLRSPYDSAERPNADIIYACRTRTSVPFAEVQTVLPPLLRTLHPSSMRAAHPI